MYILCIGVKEACYKKLEKVWNHVSISEGRSTIHITMPRCIAAFQFYKNLLNNKSFSTESVTQITANK